jgi:diguanylate cyclase (GGDEF)-like protein
VEIVARARSAVCRARIVDASPFAAADALAKEELGCPEETALHTARLAFWGTREPGSRLAEDRYRWELSHKRCPFAGHVPPRDRWGAFRPDVGIGDPKEMALSVPLSIAETCEYLERLGTPLAHEILEEALPVFRRDVAQFVQGAHPFIDTLGLFALVQRPRTLDLLRPLALAIATSYAAVVSEGSVRGLRFPYADRPLPSASSQLAAGLLVLGAELGVLVSLVDFVRSSQRSDGSFGDGDAGDLLTTFTCAELLSRLDPDFDRAPSARWMAEHADEDGLFRVLGPEGPWLTSHVVGFLEDSERPFHVRFRFPHVPQMNLDRKTGLPFFAHFDDVASLFSALGGLACADVELAFLDLAGFRAFNNAHGQDAGDAVLAEIAAALRETLRDAAVVRDGGDEYLVIGAPTRTGLAADLEAFGKAWPARFQKRFPTAEVVSARILVGHAPGRELRALRERLGQALAPLKHLDAPGKEGMLVRV